MPQVHIVALPLGVHFLDHYTLDKWGNLAPKQEIQDWLIEHCPPIPGTNLRFSFRQTYDEKLGAWVGVYGFYDPSVASLFKLTWS